MKLVDEQSPYENAPTVRIDRQRKKHVRIGDGSNSLNRRGHDKNLVLMYPFFGLPLVLNFLSFSVQEGTSVTILGMFSYDSASDTF